MTAEHGGVRLREVRPGDLERFFEHQADPHASRLAAVPSRDRDAFTAHWERILRDDALTIRTIVHGDEVVGNVLAFVRNGRREVGYWLGREHWGRGLASRALALFLAVVPERPLYAYVARHNAASARVLGKCGFAPLEEDAEGTLFVVGR